MSPNPCPEDPETLEGVSEPSDEGEEIFHPSELVTSSPPETGYAPEGALSTWAPTPGPVRMETSPPDNLKEATISLL